ncbi:ABC1 kinase family protein [Geopsychrobacter electrodiphilus]|uniref:ABC1 kinase family protein n=1 Tax=Geopsychrobacter electrodiphilus TaxID=225196 RepID=UPI000377BD88|nr:AarF/UbiB family protein [Geopsychrobacter electrodiphilus]
MSVSINPVKSSFFRAAPRLLQILRVLARHKFLGALRGKGHWPSPKEVRETFEELGLTFLKLGQVLAMRRDLLPGAYIDELELLHDQLPAMDFAAERSTIENELGDPLMLIFASFNETPIAAATIAQVHEATLHDGRRVAVKVQRPDLEEMISTDITAMTYLVKLFEGLFPRLRGLDLPVLVSEFAKSLTKETDFYHEARSIILFRTALADLPDLWIPDVLAEFSSESVLTMEFSTGERIDLYAKQHPEAMPKAIKTLVRLTLQTIFEEGLFHADPHPGNVLVLPDGRLSLLDFGMTGELDEAMRESLTHLLGAVVKGDARGATDAYLEMAPQGSEKVNRAALLLDIKAVLYDIHRNDLANVSIGKSFDSLLRAGSRHGVHNPGEFFLLTRTFVILESMIRQLDPEHDYLGAFREEITRLTKQHFSVERMKEKTGKLGHEMDRLASDGPGDLRQILRRLAEGNLGRVQAPAVEALGGRITRNLERLTTAIAAAALVIGGALLVEGRLGGWYHVLGEVMVVSGITAMVIVFVGILRGDQGRGRGRR